jgi:hypothetical protein
MNRSTSATATRQAARVPTAYVVAVTSAPSATSARVCSEYVDRVVNPPRTPVPSRGGR